MSLSPKEVTAARMELRLTGKRWICPDGFTIVHVKHGELARKMSRGGLCTDCVFEYCKPCPRQHCLDWPGMIYAKRSV